MCSVYRSRIIIASLLFSMTASVAAGQVKPVRLQEPNAAATYYVKAVEQYQLGRYEEAVAAFKLAIQFKSDYVPAYNGLALASMELSLYSDAAAALEKAIRLAPSMAELQIWVWPIAT